MSKQISMSFLALDTSKEVAALACIYTAMDMAKAQNYVGAALVGALGVALIVIDKVVLFNRLGFKL